MRLQLDAGKLTLLDGVLNPKSIMQSLYLDQLEELSEQLAGLLQDALYEVDSENEQVIEIANHPDSKMVVPLVYAHSGNVLSGTGQISQEAILQIEGVELVDREYGTRARIEVPLLAELISRLEPEISTLISDFVKGKKLG